MGRDNTAVTGRLEAAEKIGAEPVEGTNTVRYYDDATEQWYVAPIEDLDRLAELQGSEDEDERRDAYSLWCAECSHAIEGEDDEGEDGDDD